MILTPDSESLREYNSCHAPDSGQFCSSKDVTFEHGIHDYHHGQHDGSIIARDGYGVGVGRLTFSLYNGVIKIGMVEVDPERTGEGIASELLARLRKEYPKEGINPGYRTPSGEKFWQARKHIVRPSKKVKPSKPAGWQPRRRGKYLLEANDCHDDQGRFCSKFGKVRQIALKNLKANEEWLMLRDIEHCFIYDAHGGVAGRYTDGEKDAITITEEMAGHMRKNDASFTHNHPSGNGFSPDDLSVTLKYNLREMRAVSGDETGVFVMRRLGHWWPPDTRADYESANNAVRVEFWAAINAGTMTKEEANKRHHHEIFTRLFARYPKEVYYAKEPPPHAR